MAEVTKINFKGTVLDIRDANAARASDLAAKQDTINDLDAIRSGAALGATALQSYTETDPTVPAWAKQSTKPSYTASEVGAVPTTRTVNGKRLNNNIVIGMDDIPGLAEAISEAGEVKSVTINGTNHTPNSSGVVDLGTVITAHQDISGKANASDVYTKTQTDTLLSGKQNTLTFDSTPTASSTNPVTSGGVKTYVDGKASITGITTSQDGTFTIALSDGNSYTVNLNHVHPQYVESDDLAEVATSGSYNDLSDKPTIPAAQVNADWNATSGVSRILNKPTIPTVPTNVSSFTNDAGYLTQHQSLANYYTKSEIDTKIGNIETLLASI